MKTCNIIFSGKPAYTTSDTILDDIRFVNFNNFLTTGISFIIYIIIYRIWVKGHVEKAFLLAMIYAAVYVYMQTKLNYIQVKYDKNCETVKDNLYFN